MMGEDQNIPPIRYDEGMKRSLGRGIYLPPAKRRLLEQQREESGLEAGEAADPYGFEAQRKSWEEERKVIHGTINRLNDKTIKPLLHDLFDKVNLVRMRGVLAKALLQATLVSAQRYGAVYAAALSVLHSKLPEIGDLVVQRTILHFRKSYQRKDKPGCMAMCLFLGHLFHQSIVHELLILQILSLLLQGDPTDDSVQMAIRLLRLTGYALQQESPAGVRAVLEQLRGLIHQGRLHPKIQQEAEGLLEERRKGFTSQLVEELDLVEQDDQICLEISLDDDGLDAMETLDRFSVDPDYEHSLKEWQSIRSEVLGLGEDEDDDSEAETDDDSEEDEEEEEEEQGDAAAIGDGAMVVSSDKKSDLVVVQDMAEADLIHLRRTIYLTIMSSATFEECTHKLAKIDIPDGREEELVNMLLECCAQERTFLRYYGLIGSRFCFIADRWKEAFMTAFAQQYNTIHRLETNKLRNVAKLLSHLLHTDAMPWSVLSTVHLNGDETTSSSRIFLKILFQEIAEAIGMQKLKERLEAPEHAEWFAQLLPRDGNVRNTRYAINFFTSIGLGPLTDGMRTYLKDAPRLLAEEQAKRAAEEQANDSDDSSSVLTSSSSSSSSVSSSSSSSSSSSGSSRSSSSSSSSSSYSRRRRGRRRRSRSSSSSSSSSMSSGDGGSQSRGRRRRQRSYSSEEDSRRGRSRTPPAARERHQVDKGKRDTRGRDDSSRSESPRSDKNKYSDPDRERRSRGRRSSRSRSDSRSRGGRDRSISSREMRRDREDAGPSANDRVPDYAEGDRGRVRKDAIERNRSGKRRDEEKPHRRGRSRSRDSESSVDSRRGRNSPARRRRWKESGSKDEKRDDRRDKQSDGGLPDNTAHLSEADPSKGQRSERSPSVDSFGRARKH